MKAAKRIINTLVYAFLYMPLAVMIFFSFNKAKSTVAFGGFSFYWYGEVFKNSETLNALKNTLILAVVSAAVATILGTIAAIGIYLLKKKAAREAMMAVTNIPMMNPDIVTGVSLMLLFVFVGHLLGKTECLNFWTLLIAHVSFNLPYVILNVLPKLRQTDKSIFEAAQDLGASPVKAFFLVIMPQIVPGIVSGAVMSFTLSLNDYVISCFTNGMDFQTLPLLIEAMTRRKVKPDMYALSTLIFIAVLLLLIISNIIEAHSEKKQEKKI